MKAILERGRRGQEPRDVWDRVQAVVKNEIHSSKLKHYTHGDVLDLVRCSLSFSGGRNWF